MPAPNQPAAASPASISYAETRARFYSSINKISFTTRHEPDGYHSVMALHSTLALGTYELVDDAAHATMAEAEQIGCVAMWDRLMIVFENLGIEWKFGDECRPEYSAIN